MVQIPQYTRGIIRPRETAQVYNPAAIEAAGANYGQAFAQAAEWADKYVAAEEATAVNEAAIRKQKDDFDFFEAKKTEWQNNPTGFAKAMEGEFAKRSQQYESQLPTERAKQAFRETAMRLDLRAYQQATEWEQSRGVDIMASRLDSSLQNLRTLAYRAGQNGAPINDIENNLEATIVAAGTVVSQDKLDELRQKNKRDITMDYLAGRIAADPKAVLNDLDAGKYDETLGAEGLDSVYKDAIRQKNQAAKLEYEAMPDAQKYEILKLPLSVRNNNPGNIRGANGEFIKYDTPEKGRAAMENDLRIKISGRSDAMAKNFGKGYTPTLRNLIATWAPSVENDVDAYVANVTKMTGIAAGDVLKESDIPKLADAMTMVEGGKVAADYFATGTVFDDLAPDDKIAALRKMNDYREAYNAQQAILGNGLVDPGSKAQRKAMDDYYLSTEAAQMLAASDVNASIHLGEFAKQYGLIPESAQSTLRGMMMTGSPEQKQYAYATIGEIQKAAPAALKMAGGFTEKEIKDAAVFNGLIRSGATAAFARDAIEQASQPITADIRKVREKEANAELAKMTPAIAASGFDPGLFSVTPSFASEAQRDVIFADYKRIYREAFLQYGDKEKAQDAAKAAITVNAGVSKVTGSSGTMKYPPEKFYAVDGVDESDLAQEFNKQVKDALKELGYDSELKFSIQPTKSADSRASNGMKPRYNIWVEGDNGIVDLVTGKDNRPVAIEFDQTPLLAMKKQKEAQYKKRAQFTQRNFELWRGEKPKRSLSEIINTPEGAQ